MLQNLFRDKSGTQSMDLLEQGMWVDFVETGARPQRIGYGRLSQKDDDCELKSRQSFRSIVITAFSEALLLFAVSPYDLPGRIIRSLVPPILDRFRIIHIDMLGPFIALCSLWALLHFNATDKSQHVTPELAILYYTVSFPLITHFLLRCCKGAITFPQLLSLSGYSLYGPVFTLGSSLLIDSDRSNAVFFMCLAIFGGLGTLRVVLVILATLRIPAARLLICSLVALMQLLFVVFLHFTFLHPTYVFGAAARKLQNRA